MISYLAGKFEAMDPTHVIIDVNGVGYHVNISLITYGQVKELKEGRLYTHFHVKEDAHTLYGFFEESERKRFRQLTSISGVGPSTGIMILSSLTPEEIHSAIINSDVKTISSVKGIGQKTAQRIILELKDKMSKEELEAGNPIISLVANNTLKTEALAALTTLGIAKATAEKSIDQIIKQNGPEISLEDLIKFALKRA
ncbi:Holliday junction branch migration protein RuvA [Reichenbachiella versicolor]|uniref:Holliday junction branch migration protein RuvA n=1 Tax=Reichenbachiella versicolor TaxID=1821036 RepID=UPI000D6E677C|nr:Holliday junction branch migration protein RuvA [Reichenbachiella versicolor]